MIVPKDPHHAESTLLVNDTLTPDTELTGTNFTQKSRTTLVTMATDNALKKGATPWAYILEQ